MKKILALLFSIFTLSTFLKAQTPVVPIGINANTGQQKNFDPSTDSLVIGSYYTISQANANFLKTASNLSDLSSLSTARTNLGATILGSNFFTLANPSAITFSRINADNTVSLLDAATFRTAIGAASSAGTVISVTGTTNRITSTGGTTPVIDISATFEALLGKVANPLSQFASTTSSQLAGVISDETGTGSTVFNNTPTLTTPVINGTISGTTVIPIANGGTNNLSAYTTGSVIFSNGTSLIQNNTNFFWDNTNNRLGIGLTTPSSDFEVGSTTTGSHIIRVNSPFIGQTAEFQWSSGSSIAWRMYRVASSADLRLNDGTADRIWFNAGGNTGFGITPTALLTLRGGSTGAGNAPLKFTSGPLLTVNETGAIEFLTDKFYGTISSGTQRKTFSFEENNSNNILATITGINAQSIATTNLYTVPVGKTAIITSAVITATVATAIVTPPTLGIGIAAGEQDIYAATSLTGFNATNENYKFSTNGNYIKGLAGDIIKVGIDAAAVGTAMTITIDLIGYLK